MNPLVLTARESGNVLRSFWRNRSGAFLTPGMLGMAIMTGSF
jgi:hypothetical protein